jgi:multidrug efflux pump subunit AcrA (membrane-fusion protein)
MGVRQVADIIQIRRDTAANWTSANPTLAQGELGVETDTDKIKIGDGSTAWTSLGYIIDTGDYLTTETNDLTSAVTWANIPDANVPQSAVTQHQAALSITESQISDLGTYEPADATILKDADIGVNVQAYDADIMTTDNAQVMTAQLTVDEFKETTYSLTGTDIDPANGSVQYKTLSANTTFTESLEDGQSVIVRLEGGATYTVTYPTMTWIGSGGNVAPTLNGTKDTIVFWKESSTLYGAYVGYGA